MSLFSWGGVARHLLTGFPLDKLALAFVASFVFLFVGFDARKGQFKKWHALTIMIGLLIIIINGGFGNGGVRAPVVAGVFLLPMMGIITFGKKGGLFGFILSIAVLAILSILDQMNLVASYGGQKAHIFIPIIYSLISGICYLIMRAFMKAKDDSDRALRNANDSVMVHAQLSSLGEMAGGMAHEINNPLAIVIAKSTQLMDRVKSGKFSNEQICVELEKIESSAQRISKITSALREFGTSSADESKSHFFISHILDILVEFTEHRVKSTGIELKIEIENNVQIFCQQNQLLQVLLNLVFNSFDAIEDKTEKWVKIQVQQSGSKVLISVTDSGLGIPESVQEKMMMPFFTTKEIGQGTGMGLSMAHGIILAQGGNLTYDKVSKNTKFVVELPYIENTKK